MSPTAKTIRFHALLAAFMLPVGVMFLVTGGLYMWGIKGSYRTATHELALATPLEPDASALETLVRSELQRLDVSPPSGSPAVKRGGTSFWFEWTGAELDVLLSPTSDPARALLQVKETGLHRRFVQLHKGKGGPAFKVFGAVWAVALLGLFVSGMMLAMRLPHLRRAALVSLALGAISFAAFVLAS